jgi:hypothetical protein
MFINRILLTAKNSTGKGAAAKKLEPSSYPLPVIKYKTIHELSKMRPDIVGEEALKFQIKRHLKLLRTSLMKHSAMTEDLNYRINQKLTLAISPSAIRKSILLNYFKPKREFKKVSAWSLYVTKNFDSKELTEEIKRLSADYKKLTREQKDELSQEATLYTYEKMSKKDIHNEKDLEKYINCVVKELYYRLGKSAFNQMVRKNSTGYNLFIKELTQGKNNDIKTAADAWSKLSKEEKQKYTDRAAKIDAEHTAKLKQEVEEMS